MIFKDDDTRRDYLLGEIVSGLGGSEVGVVQPPFSILPVEDEGLIGSIVCVGGPDPIVTTEHEIHTVPYKYAIPMLTGWNLSYGCGDGTVEEIGVWIDDWNWDHNNPGILHYKLSTVLTPDHAVDTRRHKITVLGLRPVTLRPEEQPVK